MESQLRPVPFDRFQVACLGPHYQTTSRLRHRQDVWCFGMVFSLNCKGEDPTSMLLGAETRLEWSCSISYTWCLHGTTGGLNSTCSHRSVFYAAILTHLLRSPPGSFTVSVMHQNMPTPLQKLLLCSGVMAQGKRCYICNTIPKHHSVVVLIQLNCLLSLHIWPWRVTKNVIE